MKNVSIYCGRISISAKTAIEALAEEKQVEIRWRGQGVMIANKDLLRRALLNLVSNALRFTPAGGLIELISEQVDRGVKFTVMPDSGTGIEPQHLPYFYSVLSF